MKRFYVFKDGMQIGSAATEELAICFIRSYQKAETHPFLKAQFSMIEGEEKFISYPSHREPSAKKRSMER